VHHDDGDVPLERHDDVRDANYEHSGNDRHLGNALLRSSGKENWMAQHVQICSGHHRGSLRAGEASNDGKAHGKPFCRRWQGIKMGYDLSEMV
jgi:hypothetical protein